MSRRRTPREILGPTGGAWLRVAPGWYRHQQTGCRVMRVGSLWHVWGGYWDGAAFTRLWVAQCQVEGAGRLHQHHRQQRDPLPGSARLGGLCHTSPFR